MGYGSSGLTLGSVEAMGLTNLQDKHVRLGFLSSCQPCTDVLIKCSPTTDTLCDGKSRIACSGRSCGPGLQEPCWSPGCAVKPHWRALRGHASSLWSKHGSARTVQTPRVWLHPASLFYWHHGVSIVCHEFPWESSRPAWTLSFAAGNNSTSTL